MALVDYSSSEEDTESNQDPPRPVKRARLADKADDLPPLPSKFHDLYASTARVSTKDDPSLHNGRKRATPHVEGNWPTHIYIEWYPSPTEYTSLKNLISALQEKLPFENEAVIHSFLTSDLGAPLPLHISLSRPIGFLTEEKDGFVTSLERFISTSGIRPFEIRFCGLDWVANFEKTRWFLVLRIHQPAENGLNKLLHTSNTVVQNHGQPPLYAKAMVSSPSIDKGSSPKGTGKLSGRGRRRPEKIEWKDMQDLSSAFHISIAWTLESPSQELKKVTGALVENHFKEMSSMEVDISEIKVKVGNVVTSLGLRTNAMEGSGLFGM
ncbi:hypothetical protein HYFRA_00012938 [Hymenoscyphus fraxineus]|uniref:U6 snRNA phosphodiesterase n=1 Tax=Hymenoscyphus fraxineus TaxID=746836 RepID=A0A9N9PTA9_9HELO|nr:hypothetical protein HYFRA_00012938 [Hymenoscyphus fraxineus]